MMNTKKGSLIVISGFSGAGKGTAMQELLNRSERYALSVSMTTRSPRPGEIDGTHYFFVTRERFEEEIARGGLLEHAEYVGNYYGTPKAYVEEQLASGRDVLLEIETQGGLQIRKIFPEAVLVFIITPTVEELEARLRGRKTESEEVIQRRLAQAANEVGLIESYDYCIVNDRLEDCVDRLEAVIEASHHTSARMKSTVESLRSDFDKRNPS